MPRVFEFLFFKEDNLLPSTYDQGFQAAMTSSQGTQLVIGITGAIFMIVTCVEFTSLSKRISVLEKSLHTEDFMETKHMVGSEDRIRVPDFREPHPSMNPTATDSSMTSSEADPNDQFSATVGCASFRYL